jgi:hypothetical protein
LAAARGPSAKAADLAEARRQIAALERKVGQEQLDLVFSNEPCGTSRRHVSRKNGLA